MSSTMEVGKKLVAMCKEGKFRECIEVLYSPKIVSVEAMSPPGGKSAATEGLAGVKEKNDWWTKNHEVHNGIVDGLWPHGDRFIVRFSFDVTAKSGQMAGKRFTMEEAGLYTVKDGKIVHEEFFYNMG